MTDEGGDTRHVIGYSQDAAKHSTMHKIAPATKNYPVQNARNASSEKPWSGQARSSGVALQGH